MIKNYILPFIFMLCYSFNYGQATCSKSTPYIGGSAPGATSCYLANDFKVDANTTFQPSQIKIKIATLPLTTINSLDLVFYEDNNGFPGNQIYSYPGLTNFTFQDFSSYGEIAINLNNIAFTANTTDKVYWVGIKMAASSQFGFIFAGWSANPNVNTTYNMAKNCGSGWSYTGNEDGAFEITGICSGTLGTNDLDLKTFKFYPNPVKDKLTVSANQSILKYAIHSISGQLLSNENVNKTAFEIDFSTFPKGTYIVTLYSNDKRKVLKVNKE